MSDFQQTITSLDLLHTSLYRMELFMNAQAVKNAKTDVISLISRLEKAERERDELRAEQAEHDEQIARMEGKVSLAKRALDSKTARCEKAEAELRRRDAAAGEPVAWRYAFLPSVGDEGGWKYVEYEDLCNGSSGYVSQPLYTAAPPAVLPQNVMKHLSDAANTVSEWTHGDEHSCKVSRTALISAIEALGAQQQEVVELPTQSEYEDPLSAYEALEHVKAALDAANVKWGVKK